MAIHKCRNCSAVVAKTAAVCPQCGQTDPTWELFHWGHVFAGVILFFIASFVCGALQQ
jgi:uncharacterized OB-fold protein